MSARPTSRTVIAGLVLAVLLTGAWLWTPDLARQDVEARYARTPADFVEVAGMRLHLREDGPPGAPAVILLHGFGSSLHTWEPWVPALAQRHRVIRFDLPGVGHLPLEESPAAALDALADFLAG